MELIHDPAEVTALAERWRGSGHSVGLVPTMGALHEGHASLIERATVERERTVVSIYVNPRQFASSEDLQHYPRREAADLALCERLGVDVAWVPSHGEMEPSGVALLEPDPGPVGMVLEGEARPGHFQGVLTVVYRLFDVVGGCAAYFGEKDAQQLFLVRRMATSLGLPVDIVSCSTVRDPDGLALSSRNAYLTPKERLQAGCVFLGLSEAAALARAGERDASVLSAAIAREVGATPLARLDYAVVVDEATFEPVIEVVAPSRALVAARLPSARLIDNLRLPEVSG